MKKLMLGALAALCAMLALPAIASAESAHIHPQPTGVFGVTGTTSELSRVAGGGTNGTTITGEGEFENTTTGWLKLTFHHVTSSIGTNCNSAGQPTGTVTTTKLTFHLVRKGTVPYILITGNKTVGTPGTEGEGPWGHHFVDFTCGIFIPTVQVRGNGVLGTITAPACSTPSNTATVSFKGTNGAQEHQSFTGTNYTLESSIGEGAYSQSAMTAHATIAFANGATPTLDCT